MLSVFQISIPFHPKDIDDHPFCRFLNTLIQYLHFDFKKIIVYGLFFTTRTTIVRCLVASLYDYLFRSMLSCTANVCIWFLTLISLNKVCINVYKCITYLANLHQRFYQCLTILSKPKKEQVRRTVREELFFRFMTLIFFLHRKWMSMADPGCAYTSCYAFKENNQL